MNKILRNKLERALHANARDLMKDNHFEMLRQFLSLDSSIHLIRESGGNILSYCLVDAIGYNHVESIEVLLNAGANPDVVGECDPLNRTLTYGRHEVILTMLLKYGANPNLKLFDSHGCSPLCLAAYFARLASFRTLLLYGADPDYNCSDRDFLTTFPNARSVLGVCLKEGYEAPFVKLLIDFGADMYLPDIQGSLSSADKEAKEVLEKERGMRD